MKRNEDYLKKLKEGMKENMPEEADSGLKDSMNEKVEKKGEKNQNYMKEKEIKGRKKFGGYENRKMDRTEQRICKKKNRQKKARKDGENDLVEGGEQ